MCDFLVSLLNIVVSLVSSFSEEFAGQINEAGMGFFSETLGCEF